MELAALQDEEVGDGTTSVVIIAAELLKNADELVQQKPHPTLIIAGYRLASKEAVKYTKEQLALKVKDPLFNVFPLIFVSLLFFCIFDKLKCKG